MKKTIALLIFAVCGVLPLWGGSPDDKGFIRDWLLGGPWPSYQTNDKGTGLDADCLGGEADFRPYPGLTGKTLFKADASKLIAGIGSTNEWGFTEDREIPVSWRVFQFDKPERIELSGFWKPIDDHFVYYATCWVESPEAKKVKFRLGSDDDHKLFVNGREVGKSATSQGIIPDNFIYPGELRRGVNRILLKVVDRTAETGFCFRISDEKDQPLTDLKIHTDDPRRELGMDAYDNGFAARFSFAAKDLFTGGDQRMKLRFHAPGKGPYQLRLAQWEQRATGDGEWELTPPLKPGENALRLEVVESNQIVAVLEHTVRLYSREALRKENTALRRELEEVRRTRKALAGEFQAGEKRIAELRQGLRESWRKAEERFAGARALAATKGRPTPPEPLPGEGTRARLSLNGDWQIGVARNQMEGVVRLPASMYNVYFRTWFNPVKKRDPKNPYGAIDPLPGWEDFRFDDRLCRDEVWFARDFEVDDPARSAFFIAENLYGKAVVYLNGVRCGEYGGRIGIAEIALTNLKKGTNRLEINFFAPGKTFGFHVEDYGIRGDLYLDFMSPLRVADVWVKPSWRKATLATRTELENRGNAPATFELRQYAVKDGMIRHRLPKQKGTLAAGKGGTLSGNAVWPDPELWTLENPALYELVSDLFVNGKLIDRKRDTFGFREFWIHATDFYFNGKRIILQGDVGIPHMDNAKFCDVAWPLYRQDGINTLRIHDSSYWSPEFFRRCDRLGMFAYAQMYPVLHRGNRNPKQFTSFDEWLKEPLHQFNLDNYRAWHRMLRNHPSVVIWSTDNEVFTQAWDRLDQVEFNLRNDKLAAFYGRFVKSLDPELVMTRDGDVGTWNREGRWFEDPPCDTANYHYPDFNLSDWVKNWQQVYEFRPVIFGETLYCSYQAWNQWCGAIPSQVANKARRVREVVK